MVMNTVEVEIAFALELPKNKDNEMQIMLVDFFPVSED